jgi:N-acetylmuramoyl-L-alanine amidase
VNDLYKKYKNCIYVSIHVNAAGNGSKWMTATGWEAWTTKGVTKSDKLAEYLYKAAENILKGKKIRKDITDGDSDKESNFYVL